MKKHLFSLILAALAVLFAGCNDDLSRVGESIQPDADKVTARIDTISFIAKTVPVPKVFSRSTYTLLGELQDQTYGHLKTDFIAQLQSARGFRFSHLPREGKIDSVALLVGYNSWAGDSTAWLKASVYEIKKQLKPGHYSDDMSQYLTERNLLGSQAFRAGDIKGNHVLKVTLPTRIGQKIYDLSLSDPSAFDSDDSFYNKVLGGLYVTTTTGAGCVLSVYNSSLIIYYSYWGKTKDKDGKEKDDWVKEVERFTNTKQQILVNRFANSGLEKLLANDDPKYAYVKAPGGVTTELTFKKEDLEKALTGTDGGRIVNNASLLINTSLTGGRVLLNPPTYLLLLPKDSVATFFPEHQTELTRSRIAYLSSSYSIKARFYDFGNIAPIFTEHLKNNSEWIDGKLKVKKDLVVMLVATARESRSAGAGGHETSSLDNYIFPSAARLIVGGGEAAKVGIISTSYKSGR